MSNNLISLSDRSIEERKEIAKKGAYASANKRRQNKSLREELNILLDNKDENGITYREKISIALIKEAEKGNIKAFELISNITEGKPTKMVNNTFSMAPIIIDDIK